MLDSKNKVQTFDSFNNKCRRPDRRQHMRNCGFEIKRVLDYSYEEKPKQYVQKYLDGVSMETGNTYHAVTLKYTDYNGCTYYEVWVKAT